MEFFSKAILRSKSIRIGGSVVLAMILIALLAPFLSPYSPLEMDIPNMMARPSGEHLFGTDEYGRDVLSRVVFGTRISIRIGMSVAIFTGILGIGIGAIAGSFPRLDNPLMRVMDAMMSIPSILLALAIVAALGPAEITTITALAITYTPRTARIIRAAVLSVKEQYFVEAARAIGAGSTRILLRHILVNCVGPIIVQQSFIFAYAILAEAMLSFLGVGPPPPTPSWGNIISEGRVTLRVAPWVMLFPGFAILITVLGINMLGDGLRDTIDPKHRVREK